MCIYVYPKLLFPVRAWESRSKYEPALLNCDCRQATLNFRKKKKALPRPINSWNHRLLQKCRYSCFFVHASEVHIQAENLPLFVLRENLQMRVFIISSCVEFTIFIFLKFWKNDFSQNHRFQHFIHRKFMLCDFHFSVIRRHCNSAFWPGSGPGPGQGRQLPSRRFPPPPVLHLQGHVNIYVYTCVCIHIYMYIQRRDNSSYGKCKFWNSVLGEHFASQLLTGASKLPPHPP